MHASGAPRSAPLPLPSSSSSRNSGKKRTASPSTTSLDLHNLADSWSISLSRTLSRPSPLSSTSSTILGDESTNGNEAPGSAAGGWQWESSWAGVDEAQHQMDKKVDGWACTANVGHDFALDETDGCDPVPPYQSRSNSLELDFGDLPPPTFFSASSAYPSPCSPASGCIGIGSYFPLQRSFLTLPPSPRLVPLALDSPCPSPAFLPAPRVQASTTHPLHRAKRLSMTPLRSPSALPAVEVVEEPVVPKMKQRKGSLVDLPLVPVDAMPLTPPTTPIACDASLPKLQEEKKKDKGSRALAPLR
ncbi:hypothetical protein JCM11641_003213 [Rhodosporidiobolus odoratus]